MRATQRLENVMSNTPYLIFTSGLIGQDTSRDWGIKWASPNFNTAPYQTPILKLVSRLIREAAILPETGCLYHHPDGIAALFPHQDQVQRMSYFMVFFPYSPPITPAANTKNTTAQDWQQFPLTPQQQAWLAELAACHLHEKLRAFDQQAIPLPGQLPALTPAIIPVSPLKADLTSSTPLQPPASPHFASFNKIFSHFFLHFKIKKCFLMMAMTISILIGTILIGYYYYNNANYSPANTPHKPLNQQPPELCDCYTRWWQQFYEPQAPRLFQPGTASWLFTPVQCQAACRWTGQTLPLAQLLQPMQQPAFWQLQYPLMQAQAGCAGIQPHLYSALDQCTQSAFSRFITAMIQQCGTLVCNPH